MSRRTVAPRRTSIAALVMITGSAVVAAGVAASPASSAGSDPGPGQRTVTTSNVMTRSLAQVSDSLRVPGAQGATRLDDAAQSRRVLAYWTPRRMREAIPYESVEATSYAGAGRVTSSPPPAQPARTFASPTAPTSGQEQSRGARVRFTNKAGKVFFTKDGANYVCSGSAVNSRSKRIVATAGHCVHGGKGGSFHTNWMYEAGYSSGAKAGGRGRFTAYAFRTFRDWVRYGGRTARGFNSDVAFVTTNRSPATHKRLVAGFGGMGLRTGGGYRLPITVFGYPANLSGGENQYACRGRTGKRSLGRRGHRHHFLSIRGCHFGGGASGGPWLTGYRNRTRRGTIRTVSSFGPSGKPRYIAGPYFRRAVGRMLQAANHDFHG